MFTCARLIIRFFGVDTPLLMKDKISFSSSDARPQTPSTEYFKLSCDSLVMKLSMSDESELYVRHIGLDKPEHRGTAESMSLLEELSLCAGTSCNTEILLGIMEGEHINYGVNQAA